MSVPPRTRECLLCGMLNVVCLPDIAEGLGGLVCAKCDSDLMAQSDGSTLTIDIAHHHETVLQALTKFEHALNQAWHGYTAKLRLIVGGGLIRDAVLAELFFKRSQGIVLNFSEENRGALLIRVRTDSVF